MPWPWRVRPLQSAAAASMGTAWPHGASPWGADGYGGQQAGVQGGQTQAAALPAPLPADGHGWAGGLKGGLTNFLQSAHSRN